MKGPWPACSAKSSRFAQMRDWPRSGVPPVLWALDRWAVWPGSRDRCRGRQSRRIRLSSAARRCACSGPAAVRSRSAQELGCSPRSLGNWAGRVDVDEGRAEGLSSDEREELRRLRREVRTLSEERAILRQAAACFAKQDSETRR
jgi:transposase-like protein